MYKVLAGIVFDPVVDILAIVCQLWVVLPELLDIAFEIAELVLLVLLKLMAGL
ncbi:hypothetical protein LDJ79_00850 [Vibrio tritonius]|uniref:Uncharacterized protein n=1 Tax=Vibrio tritonius TaxID=1435069 RepID=A0ABS7YHX7_9VIBR|nr:hypothetical protein [Vibrio tritonius]MCA2014637.1 hypothetical protein [Vibrio tritonius]